MGPFLNPYLSRLLESVFDINVLHLRIAANLTLDCVSRHRNVLALKHLSDLDFQELCLRIIDKPDCETKQSLLKLMMPGENATVNHWQSLSFTPPQVEFMKTLELRVDEKAVEPAADGLSAGIASALKELEMQDPPVSLIKAVRDKQPLPKCLSWIFSANFLFDDLISFQRPVLAEEIRLICQILEDCLKTPVESPLNPNDGDLLFSIFSGLKEPIQWSCDIVSKEYPVELRNSALRLLIPESQTELHGCFELSSAQRAMLANINNLDQAFSRYLAQNLVRLWIRGYLADMPDFVKFIMDEFGHDMNAILTQFSFLNVSVSVLEFPDITVLNVTFDLTSLARNGPEEAFKQAQSILPHCLRGELVGSKDPCFVPQEATHVFRYPSDDEDQCDLVQKDLLGSDDESGCLPKSEGAEEKLGKPYTIEIFVNQLHQELKAEFPDLEAEALLGIIIKIIQEKQYDVSSWGQDEYMAFLRWGEEGLILKRVSQLLEAANSKPSENILPERWLIETAEAMANHAQADWDVIQDKNPDNDGLQPLPNLRVEVYAAVYASAISLLFQKKSPAECNEFSLSLWLIQNKETVVIIVFELVKIIRELSSILAGSEYTLLQEISGILFGQDSLPQGALEWESFYTENQRDIITAVCSKTLTSQSPPSAVASPRESALRSNFIPALIEGIQGFIPHKISQQAGLRYFLEQLILQYCSLCQENTAAWDAQRWGVFIGPYLDTVIADATRHLSSSSPLPGGSKESSLAQLELPPTSLQEQLASLGMDPGPLPPLPPLAGVAAIGFESLPQPSMSDSYQLLPSGDKDDDEEPVLPTEDNELIKAATGRLNRNRAEIMQTCRSSEPDWEQNLLGLVQVTAAPQDVDRIKRTACCVILYSIGDAMHLEVINKSSALAADRQSSAGSSCPPGVLARSPAMFAGSSVAAAADAVPGDSLQDGPESPASAALGAAQ